MRSSEACCRDITAERRGKLCGIVRVAINSLRFYPDGDPYNLNTDEKKVAALRRMFQASGCNRLSPKHRIYGNITAAGFEAALAYSELQRNDLLDEASPPILSLPRNQFVYCAQGRSRVHAFMQLKQARTKTDRWWTIELYQDLSTLALSTLAEEFESEQDNSDGLKLWKIFECRKYHDMLRQRQWEGQLSSSKAQITRQLFKHPRIVMCLFRVLKMPGMRHQLQLTLIRDWISSRLEEELVHALDLLYKTWVTIMGSEKELQYVDQKSISHVQLRAPAVSKVDRSYIAHVIKDGLAFKGVRDSERRRRIENNILGVDYLIPSLHSIQQDGKYIRPCGAVVRKLLYPYDCPLQHSVRRLALTAFHKRNPSSATLDCPIFSGQLKLLYIKVMQNVVALTGQRCLLEVDEKPGPALTHDKGAWVTLAKQAWELGFDSGCIRNLVATSPEREMVRQMCLEVRKATDYVYDENDIEEYIQYSLNFFGRARPLSNPETTNVELTGEDGELLGRRCGRQFSAAYFRDRHHYVSHTVNCTVTPGQDVMSLFVWKSQFHCFWGNGIIPEPPIMPARNDGHRSTLPQSATSFSMEGVEDSNLPWPITPPEYGTLELQTVPVNIHSPNVLEEHPHSSNDQPEAQNPTGRAYPQPQVSENGEFGNLAANSTTRIEDITAQITREIINHEEELQALDTDMSDATDDDYGQEEHQLDIGMTDGFNLDQARRPRHARGNETRQTSNIHRVTKLSRPNAPPKSQSQFIVNKLDSIPNLASSPLSSTAAGNRGETKTNVWVLDISTRKWYLHSSLSGNSLIKTVQELLMLDKLFLINQDERGINPDDVGNWLDVYITDSENGFDGEFPFEL